MNQSITKRLTQAVAILLFGLCLVTLRVSGAYTEPGDPLENMRTMTVREATEYGGHRTGPVRLDGRLRAESPVIMPDNGEPVLRGWLKVRILGHKIGASQSLSRTLFSWEEVAHPIYLEQDNVLIQLRTSPLDLPLYRDVSLQSTIVYKDGLPVKVRVGQLSWPIEGEDWADTEVEVKVERAHLPLGLAVSTLAAVDGTDSAAVLTPLPGSGMLVAEQWATQQGPGDRAAVSWLFVLGLLLSLTGIYKIRSLIADLHAASNKQILPQEPTRPPTHAPEDSAALPAHPH